MLPIEILLNLHILIYQVFHFLIIPHATSCGGYNVFDPSVSHSVSTVFLVSATPLKPLNRILWNFVVIKNIMCTCADHQEIFIRFFSRSNALFELCNLAKMKDTTETVFSAIPLKLLNRISWNFVVMKDLMCRCAYPQDILFQFIFEFFSRVFSRSNALFELWILAKMKDAVQNSLSA